jgi:glycosyltransferase involved in cell wall biosynthesis
VAEVTAEVFGLDFHAIRILPNPIDLSMWTAGDPTEIEDGLILFSGSVHWVKGAAELAEAFVIVQREFPKSRLVYMGRDRPHPDRPGSSYSEYISQHVPKTVRSAVGFVGHQPPDMVRQWLRRAAVVALPSFAEGHSNAITEAQATGRAIVFGNRGSAPEVIEDGVSGLLCEPSDPEDIARKICLVLGDSELRGSLGEEARHAAKARFSIDVLYPKNLEFYEDVLAGIRRSSSS